jgi:metallo-beta-lactamase family protein
MDVTFWGAAGTVTGSRFHIRTERSQILVDCGQFQGNRALRRRNWEPFPVDPSEIDAVVLTHAHIDHSGYLPALVRDGFRGPIWCTRATKDLCELLLRDSAMLQEEEAYYANKHRSSRHDPALPLFTIDDAQAAIDLLQTRMFDHEFPVTDDLTASFSRVGHILGASCVRISDGESSVLFSGDVGRSNDPIMKPPSPPPTADMLVLESTYGDRLHAPTDPSEELAAIATETLGRGGILLIPSFAVGRTQTILHLLAELRWNGNIPDVPIYLNSPMAIDATEIMLEYSSEHRLTSDECRRISEGVHFTASVEDSIELTRTSGPMIVLSASGMATGGRVLHHLRQVLPQPESTVVFVGHQAAGTRGQLLADGAPSVRIFGEFVDVQCSIRHIQSLSAHADRNELIDWISQMEQPPQMTYIVHGEPSAAEAMCNEIETRLGWTVDIADHGETGVVPQPRR